MLFNSYIFLFLFLPLALAGWFLLNRFGYYRVAQGYLIGMSLWFYSYLNPRFLWMILISALFNYFLSALMDRLQRRTQKTGPCLAVGIAVNVGALGVFKYCNFFIENMNRVFQLDWQTKNILLPLGISFITFQQLSFLIDRHRKEIPHYNLTDYLSFITFFPSLISGPIVLHAATVSQFQDRKRRCFDIQRFSEGLIRFVLGLGKKVLLADLLAKAVEYGYSHLYYLDTVSALAAAVAYTLELYFDFSGYSDMAVGVGRMFGIDLPENFCSPYRAVSVKDFWKRWHMTLGSFLQTYIYFPLGGSRKGKARTFLNTMITFLISGLWHGAGWTYVFWGLLQGLGVAVTGKAGARASVKSDRKFVPEGKRAEKTASAGICVRRAVTFLYICASLVFFRADRISDGFLLLSRIFTGGWTGNLKEMAAAMEPAEIYALTKALSLAAPSFVWAAQTMVLLLVFAVSFVVLAGPGAKQISERKELSFPLTLGLAVVFFWSVISLSGVSSFVYFTF